MKSLDIKSRLVLWFIAIFGIIWMVSSVVIYLASSNYREEEFYRRLQSRAELIARLLIDEEQVDADLLRKIEDASPIRLPGEKITVYDFANLEIFTNDPNDILRIDAEIFDEVRLSEEIRWVQEPGHIEVLGILYKGQYDRFVVIAGANDVYGLRKLDNLRNILVIAFLASLLIAGLLGKVYAAQALAPIHQVIQEVNRIDPAKLDGRVSEGNGYDEIAQLGLTFNKMLIRMQAAFESQKSFLANSSHELRTPMTRILSQIDLTLLRAHEAAEYRQALEVVKQEISRMSDLTTKLLLLSRLESFEESFQVIRMDSIVWQAISEYKLMKPDVAITVDISDEVNDEMQLQVRGNEQLLINAFLNLIDNAYKYSNGQDISVYMEPSGAFFGIRIRDQGIGVPQNELERIGKPFYRAHNSALTPGSGIGLSLVKKIVQLHSGHFQIEPSAPCGTTVLMSFPLA